MPGGLESLLEEHPEGVMDGWNRVHTQSALAAHTHAHTDILPLTVFVGMRAGKDQSQKKKRAAEDEMTEWHHQFNRHELG